MTKFHVSYMDNAVFDLPATLVAAQDALADVEFDTIVGTGFSGSIIIPALALSMGKKFVLIRKEGDDSHHGSGRLVGELGERWIFVDDLISSGRTRARVIRKIDDALLGSRDKSLMVGQYMYQGFDSAGYTPYSPAWNQEEW